MTDDSDFDLTAFNCMDCESNTLELSEFYVVYSSVWDQAVAPAHVSYLRELRVRIDALDSNSEEWAQLVREVSEFTGGMLCIVCLENRLGRRLTPDDFTDAPVNMPYFDAKSDQLLERMGVI